MQKRSRNELIVDLFVIVLSVIIAVLIAKSNVIMDILAASEELEYISIFIAGVFFTSAFTVAPATVALSQIVQVNHLATVLIIGTIGAVIGDLILFYFVKDHLSEDVKYMLKGRKTKRLFLIFKHMRFRWLAQVVGAIIIASPLPDELGIFLMGFSKLRLSKFIIISATFNFLGILIISLIRKFA